MVFEVIYGLLGAQVELVKATRQNYSLSHILDVYRGSLSQSVRSYKFYLFICLWCVSVISGGVEVCSC